MPPYYLSLYPGLLALALIAASGRPRGRAAWWAWGGIAFGIFLSLGRFNPVAEWLFTLPGQKSLRYPVKFWLPVAIGAALLCGIGFERLLVRRGGAPASFRWALLLLALAFAAFWAFLTFGARARRGLARPVHLPPGRLRRQRAPALGRPLPSSRSSSWRRSGSPCGSPAVPGRSGARCSLGVHAAAQLWLLRPLYPTDAVAPYLVPPPALAHVPADALVVNPDYNYLFGPSTLRQGRFPEQHTRWLERRSFYELYPFSGPVWGRRYELNISPEGLDTFLTRLAQIQVTRAKEPGAPAHARRLGRRPAAGQPPAGPVPPHARLLATVPSFGKTLYVYEVTDRAPEVFLARRVFRERDLPAAYRRLATPDFDPRTDAVLSGPGKPARSAGGTARLVRQGTRGDGDRDPEPRGVPPGRPARQPPVQGDGRRPARPGDDGQRPPHRGRGARGDAPGEALPRPRATAPLAPGRPGGAAAPARACGVGEKRSQAERNSPSMVP